MSEDNYSYEIRQWDSEIQSFIHESSPQKYDLIAQGMTKQDEFMLVSYPFGSEMLRSGEFYLPTVSGATKKYDDALASKALQKFINSKDMVIHPFGMIKKGCLDVHWASDDRVILVEMLNESNFIGTRNFTKQADLLNIKGAWTINSGVRTLALLPSIKDYEKHKKLKQYFNMPDEIPKQFYQQGSMFAGIAKAVAPNWETKILFFSSKTVKKMCERKGFSALREWICTMLFGATFFKINKESFDFIWHQFICYLDKKGIRVKSYINDFTKHLILVALGEHFGFIPASNNGLLPMKELQSAFEGKYKLDYYPSLVHAARLKDSINNAVYCSLQYSIHPNLSPGKYDFVNISVMDDLRAVKAIQTKFFEFIKSPEGSCTRDSALEKLPENTEFIYFHTVKDRLRELSTSHDVINSDERFLSAIRESGNRLPFCYSSAFFKGCVRVRRI